MSLVSKMDNDVYEATKAVICPYCAVKLPDTLYPGYAQKDSRWSHAIPNTDHRFDCLASRFRAARYDPSDEPKERA